jgi:hypothetical protein
MGFGKVAHCEAKRFFDNTLRACGGRKPQPNQSRKRLMEINMLMESGGSPWSTNAKVAELMERLETMTLEGCRLVAIPDSLFRG